MVHLAVRTQEEAVRELKTASARDVLLAHGPRTCPSKASTAPWQNPFAERLIGSIRRECLDHFIVLNERHLRRLLRSYLKYYNTARPHQALDNNSPHPRQVPPPTRGRIVALPQVGGLHHRYEHAA